jgi:hypothetical protein
MDMKYFIFLALMVNLFFAQAANGNRSFSMRILNVINTRSAVTYINQDLNADGETEVLKGEKIIKTSDNEYWIKNTSLTTESGNVFIFDEKLKKNSVPLIKQVKADYGYILEFISGENEFIVYIADNNGSKDSDGISILLY